MKNILVFLIPLSIIDRYDIIKRNDLAVLLSMKINKKAPWSCSEFHKRFPYFLALLFLFIKQLKNTRRTS